MGRTSQAKMTGMQYWERVAWARLRNAHKEILKKKNYAEVKTRVIDHLAELLFGRRRR